MLTFARDRSVARLDPDKSAQCLKMLMDLYDIAEALQGHMLNTINAEQIYESFAYMDLFQQYKQRYNYRFVFMQA